MTEALAGVVGFPVEHSLSPEIFEVISKKTGMALEYRKLPIPPRELKKKLREAQSERSFRGWNVTIPHKEKAARELASLDGASRVLRAVNVIDFRVKTARGYNTDVQGVRETLRRRKFSCRGKAAVIFGAGGGAAAVAFALAEEGMAEIVFVNRDVGRARALSARLRAHFPRVRFAALANTSQVHGGASLYVNATPRGMKGFPSSPRLPALLCKDVLAFDLVYRPLETRFLRLARSKGARTADGLDMLVAQAIASWEIWFGKLPSRLKREALHAAVRRRLIRRLNGDRR